MSTKEQRKAWGSLGGLIRAAKLSAKRRREIARKAVAAREAQRKARMAAA